MKIISFAILIFFSFNIIFAQETRATSIILSQNYEKKPAAKNIEDSAFFAVQISYSKLVDYEAYETPAGKTVLANCENALKINEKQKDESLKLYRKAILEGISGTILLKRNSYIKGIAKMNDSQKSWEKLTNGKYANEANFALGLAEYYKITLFNKSPKTEKFNIALEKMRGAVSTNDETSLYLSLSYIWVLQEQKLWDEAQKIIDKFFEKYPNNTMMLRAAQTIAVDKKNTEEIKTAANRLYEISKGRNPKNYSDMLSAKSSLIFAFDLENKKDEACKIANLAALEYENIPPQTKKTFWVKKHYETITKYLTHLRCEKIK
ncbi:MAG: hypothetical protein FWF51_07000 [Chitinivibrionia bacterium]|nr:hypothetical protein [Chitinivibrionia bacterium]